MKKLKELFPHALLSAVFLLSLSFFALTALFPSWFYRTMDVASYLVFHNIAEFFSVMVSLSIFGVAWFTYEQSKNRHALFLGCAFLAVGLMDFMHTLGYSGMPAFITPNSSLKSTQFWIAVRMYSALTFLVSGYVYPGSSSRLLSKGFLLASAVAVSGVVFAGVTYFPSYLPVTIIEGMGVTPFKMYSEYLIMLLFALSIPAYWRRYADTGKQQFLYYMAAFIICIFSELAFSGYQSVFDTYNVLGHIYKVIAFALIYQGIFIAAVKFPYLELASKNEEIMREAEARKKAEEASRKYAEEVQDLYNNAPCGYHSLDKNGVFVRINATELAWLGYTQDEIVGKKRFPDLVTEKSLQTFRENFPRFMKQGWIKDLEFDVVRKDGAILPVLMSATAIYDADGNYLMSRSSVFDITERKRAEEDLRKSEERFKALADTSPLAIYASVGIGQKATYINQTFVKLFGYTPEEIPSVTQWWPLAYPDENYRRQVEEEWQRKVAKAIETHSEIEPMEAVVNCKDGSQKNILWGFKTLEEENWAFGLDLTERKKSEERLKNIEWLLKPRVFSEEKFAPTYGDLTKYNTDRTILNALGSETIKTIVNDYLALLETSSTVYERNGDYAAGIFSSGWCQFLDNASFKLCKTDDNKQALNCGKWSCRESCWSEASKTAIENGIPTDIECAGGLRLYAVPIRSGNEIIGAINFGYGDPPQNPEKLNDIATKYQVDVKELTKLARAYQTRPQFIIDLAKYRLVESAKFIGLLVENKRIEEQIKSQIDELHRWQAIMLGREERVQEMKREVNELCRRLGEPLSYPSQETGTDKKRV